MKRSLLSISVALVATAVFAQGPVTSVNVVGFNKHTLTRNKLYLIATAFEDIEGKTLKSSDVFGAQLPNGTVVNYYDGVTPYKTDIRVANNWSTNITYHGFMAFFIKVTPGSAPPLNWDLVLKGQVPGIGPAEISEASNVVVNGFNMLAFPYTADTAFTNTGLYAIPGNGHQLHVFKPDTTNYSFWTKAANKWPDGAKELTLKQGEGFWFKLNGVAVPGGKVLDVEKRPYPNG